MIDAFTTEMKDIAGVLRNAGFDLRMVGGAVRDLLVGKTPKDYDFCTDATPDEMIQVFARAGYKTLPTGLQHGTITVLGQDGQYEITTLRADVETDGRHAKVEFIRDWQGDAARRDFTINAMSLDQDGVLYDYFGGQDDLHAGLVRFVGNPEDRIREDYLRILRYFRFCGRMGKVVVTREIREVMRKNAHGLEQISGERIWSELRQILSGNIVELLLVEMRQCGILTWISTQGVNLAARIRKVDTDPVLLLIALMHPVGLTPWQNTAQTIVERLKLSARDRDRILNCSKVVAQLVHYFGRLDDYLICVEQIPKQTLYDLRMVQRMIDRALEIKQTDYPVFPVTGQDLIQLGLKPGPVFGKVLKKLRGYWYENRFPTREQIIDQINQNREEWLNP